jgi:hypothetical protein
MGAKALADFIPVLGQIIAAFLEAAEVVGTIDDLRKLADEIKVALDFLKKGPHSLQELQVSSPDYQQFSNYDQFIKVQCILETILSKRFGGAGDGYQYHHIVTQGGANENNIPPEQLQNTQNIIRLPTLLHEAVNDAYSQIKDGTNMTVYEWVQTQPYDVQREEGLKILRNLHIIE